MSDYSTPGFARYATTLYWERQVGRRLDEATAQMATGKKSSAQLSGSDRVQASQARSEASIRDTYSEVSTLYAVRLKTADLAAEKITTRFDTLLSQALVETTSGAPGRDLRLEAKSAYKDLVDLLNTQSNGSYLFGGGNPSAEPIPKAGSDAYFARIGAGVAQLTTGATGADVETLNAAAKTTGVPFTVDAEKPSYPVRIDDTRTMTQTMAAGRPEVASMMKGLATIANLPDPSTLTAAQRQEYNTVLKQAIKDVTDGKNRFITNRAIDAGAVRSAERTSQYHKSLADIARRQVSSIEDVDMAEVSTQVQRYQAQQQIVYKMLAMQKESQTRILDLFA